MSRRSKAVIAAGAIACAISGAAATYILAVQPVLRLSEVQPFYILSEQTFVLKSLRGGKEEQLRRLMDQAVWSQISMHASRIAEGKSPPEPLQPDIAYHCNLLRGASDGIGRNSSPHRVVFYAEAVSVSSVA